MAVTNITKNTKVSFAYVPKDVEFKNPSDNIIYFIADQQKIYLDGVYYGYADGDFSLNSIIDEGNGNAITGLTAKGKTITATREFTFAKLTELEALAIKLEALQGAFVYMGTIELSTENVTPELLNAKIIEIRASSIYEDKEAQIGDVLVDNNNVEWYYNGTTWNDYGQGQISEATQSTAGLLSANDKKKLDTIDNGANKYILPAAAITALGGVSVIDNTELTQTVQSRTTMPDRTYAIQLNAHNQMVVNVPWQNDNTWKLNTKESEGYVAAGKNNKNKVWKTDADGNPNWGDEQPIPNLSGGASAVTGKYVSEVKVSGHTVTVTQESLPTLVESANKLNTARNIKIGNKSLSFNGTAPLTYTLDEIFNVNSAGVLERNSSGAYQTSNNYVKGGYGEDNNFYIDGIHRIMFTDDSNPWHSSSERNVIYAKIKEINQEDFREYLVLGGRDGIILENGGGNDHAEYEYEPNLNLINRKTLIHKGYVDDAISNAFDLYLNWTVIS